MNSFSDPAVEAHFEMYPTEVRKTMLALRALIFETAARGNGVGTLSEAPDAAGGDDSQSR